MSRRAAKALVILCAVLAVSGGSVRLWAAGRQPSAQTSRSLTSKGVPLSSPTADPPAATRTVPSPVAPLNPAAATPQDLIVAAPASIITGRPFKMDVEPYGLPDLPAATPIFLSVQIVQAGQAVGPERSVQLLPEELVASGNKITLEDLVVPESGRAEIRVTAGTLVKRLHVRALPGLLTILPPLLAILLAILFRQVVISLLAGVWLGALFLTGFDPLRASLRVADTYLLDALVDRGHASIIVFSMLLGGMVAIISRAGGTHGIVEAVHRWADGRRSTQVVTWIMGMFIFFDDYANTLMVGNTMRPVTDRAKISREKLAYLVDCTAAPIASIALVSTWIGTEVSFIGDALKDIGSPLDPYQVFLASIPYRFYPLLALVFALAVAALGRDFGPMLRAERRAAAGRLMAADAMPLADDTSQRLAPKDGMPRRWVNAVLPIAVVIGVTMAGLWFTGRAALLDSGNALGKVSLAGLLTSSHPIQDLGTIFSRADSYATLMWGSVLGCFLAGVLAVGQRILTLAETVEAWMTGLKSMLLAIVILLLAWSIGTICKDLQTASYLVGLVSDTIPWAILPALIFVIAGGISFATGTSWGTMGILMPLTVPLAHEIAGLNHLSPEHTHILLLGAISSVLAGATWGDHCSPISDTTILSSMASGSDHIDHVRTQLPYALVVGLVGILVGDIPTAFGLSPWISLLAASAILIWLLFYLGRKVDPEAAASQTGSILKSART